MTDAEPIDITVGNHAVANKRVSALHAVAGGGKVQVALRGGTTTTIYLAQGETFRCDVGTVVRAGTDAVFQSAAGDLVGVVDRIE